MIKGQIFEGFLLVKSAEQRVSSNGSKYLDITLGDNSGDINGKMWDGTVAAPKAGSVVKARALLQEYNNRPQLRVDKLRPQDESDQVDMDVLIRTAPEPAEKMMGEIQERIERIKDEKLREVVNIRLGESGKKLMYYPAAQRLHHAERSGLLNHMSTMLRAAEALCGVYPALDSDLLAAGIVLHDLCKLTELSADEAGIVGEYTREGLLLGHIAVGVSKIEAACRAAGAPEEMRLALAHMILSHHDKPEFGSPRSPMFPEAEALHILDLLDARLDEMLRALAAVPPGGFTEKIWSLDRKLYRRGRT
jgi:3'-5' exoribonuclease